VEATNTPPGRKRRPQASTCRAFALANHQGPDVAGVGRLQETMGDRLQETVGEDEAASLNNHRRERGTPN
jgi:hypothetical protein